MRLRLSVCDGAQIAKYFNVFLIRRAHAPGGGRISRPNCFPNPHPARDVLRLLRTQRGIRESQRDSVPKPRVARHELPWVIVREKFPTATRLRPFHFHRSRTNGRNLVEVVSNSEREPKVGVNAPTLGWRPMPRWGIQTMPHATRVTFALAHGFQF